MNEYIYALIGTMLCFSATSFGSMAVFFFNKVSDKLNKICLGFASGIMIAASIWSLIIPALDMTSNFLVILLGFISGGLFLILINKLISKIDGKNKYKKNKNFMLFLAIMLHNIPEGMAVGLAFASAATVNSSVTLVSAFAFAIGIAIQNIPEGAAISLPLRSSGMSKGKSFLFGLGSGIVEPIFGVVTVCIMGFVSQTLPFFLSFAAGTMIFVVCSDLIPECQVKDSNLGAIACLIGFSVMMSLDVLLG